MNHAVSPDVTPSAYLSGRSQLFFSGSVTKLEPASLSAASCFCFGIVPPHKLIKCWLFTYLYSRSQISFQGNIIKFKPASLSATVIPVPGQWLECVTLTHRILTFCLTKLHDTLYAWVWKIKYSLNYQRIGYKMTNISYFTLEVFPSLIHFTTSSFTWLTLHVVCISQAH